MIEHAHALKRLLFTLIYCEIGVGGSISFGFDTFYITAVDAGMVNREYHGLLHSTANSRMNPIAVSPLRAAPVANIHLAQELASRAGAYVRGRESATSKDIQFSDYKFSRAFGDYSHLSNFENIDRPQPHVVKQDRLLEKNYVRADPSYLKTLGQAHSGWIFGAIAELVDNSRDAKASKLVDLLISSYNFLFLIFTILLCAICYFI